MRPSKGKVLGLPSSLTRPVADFFYPKSVIRVQSDIVLLPCRLSATFAEGVAGYTETKRQTICR